MCFYHILKGLFCMDEGTKTWGQCREQAILSGQFLWYLCLLVFREKRNRLTWWFFHFFLLDIGCTFGIYKLQDQQRGVTLYCNPPLVVFNFFFIFSWTIRRKMHKIILEDV